MKKELSDLLGTYNVTVCGNGIQTTSAENYNCVFDFTSGYMERWGSVVESDDTPPVPEVCDFEVTTSCCGVQSPKPGAGGPCKMCYKALTPKGTNMSFDTFKTVFDKLPQTLTQIAFSADSCLKSNPELFDMMRYCRDNGSNYVVPSISVAQLWRPEAVKLIESGVGCVGVSLYDDPDVCYDTVKLLTDVCEEYNYPGQVNIQAVVSQQTLPQLMQTIDDIGSDPRLAKINCIVYLSLKQKGRGGAYTPLTDEQWKALLQKTAEHIPFFGVDVCTTKKLLAFEGENDDTRQVAEPCDAGYYSMYINVEGKMYPCSFLEGVGDWETGEDLLESDFGDIWTGPRFDAHRRKLDAIRCLTCDKSCVYWEI